MLTGLVVAVSSLLVPALVPVAAHAAPSATPSTVASALPAAKDADAGVTVSVTPATTAVLQPDQDLLLSITITNSGDAVIPVGVLDVYLAQRALTTRNALDKWLHPQNQGNPGDLMLSTASIAEVPVGAAVTQQVSVPAAAVPLTTSNAWGARGVAATLSTDTHDISEGRGTFVWVLDEQVTPVKLGLVVPITVPTEEATGLIPATLLESYTGPTGLLSRELDGVVDRTVTIAIDPMIIASIRILGSGAPPDAIAWLDRLQRATNDIFPLGYADADLSLQAQAGVPAALVPLSFDHALDPALFSAPPATEATATTGTPAATPTPEPGAGAVPTSAELLAWNYTATDIAWPRSGAVARTDLDMFAASGLTTTILSGSNVSQTKTATPNSASTLEVGDALVADDALSAAVEDAATATTDAAWRDAVAEAGSLLAVIAAEQPSTARTLMATLDRGWAQSSARLGQTLDALGTLAWETRIGLSPLRAAAPASDVTFDPQAEPPARVDGARKLLQREAEVSAFATAAIDPLALTAPYRLKMLALFGTAWADHPGAWSELVSTKLAESRQILSAVSVTTRGPINVAADKVDFPITLRNELSQAVTVTVQVVPSNGRLLVGSDIEATINANSSTRMTIPVTAAVGNGAVTLRVSMFTPAGVEVGVPALIAVNVHADWEGIGAWVLATAAILFFGFGLWRNIVRRRRERSSGTGSAAEAPAPAAPATDPHV